MASPVAMQIDPNGEPVGINIQNHSLESYFMPYKGEQTLTTQNVDLFKKLGDIFGELGWISKGSTMAGGGMSYQYTSESQFIAEVRPLFVKYRIMMLPTQSMPVQVHIVDKGNGKVSTLTTVNMEYKLVDCDTGQSITIAMPGQGVDSGDKGVYKALTGALKYVLREAFLIGTGDDPEGYDDEGRVVGKENGKAESPTARGRRVIRDMVDSLEKKNEVVKILDKSGVDYRNVADDVDVMKAVYTFVTKVANGENVADAGPIFTAEMQKLGK